MAGQGSKGGGTVHQPIAAQAVTTQTQALADFSLQVRKGSTWPLRVKGNQEGEEGRFWLAKIKDEPERLEGTMTFAGQAFKEG